MNVRFGLVLAVSLAVVSGACASAGGGDGGGGVSPRDTENTQAAQLYLTQAQTADDEAVAQEHYQNALDAAMEGIQADSMNPLAYWQAGRAAASLGNYAQADTLLEKATDLYPEYSQDALALREQAWIDAYNSAIEPLNQGDLERARDLFEAANMMYDGRPEAYLNLGAVYTRLGQPERAAEAYQRALDIINSPRIEEVDSATAASWRQNEELAVFNLGQNQAQAGDFEAAARTYQRYLNDNPDNVAAISNLAVVLVNAEMPDSAMALYEELLNRPDLGSREYFSAGVGLYQIEQYERSAEAFRSALEINPRSRDALFNLLQTQFTMEDWQGVLESTERLLELDRYNSNVYKMRAKALVETGDQQTAGDVIEELQGLPMEISGLQLQPSPGGGAILAGVVTNRSLDQGTPIVIRAHFSGPDGQEVGTAETTVQAPAQDGTTNFQVQISTDQEVDGYRYEVVQP